MSPDDARAALRDGQDAFRQGNLDKAANLLTAASACLPAGEFPWMVLAQVQIKQEQFLQAGASLEKILAISPRDLRALLLRAWALEKHGDDRAAASFYMAALNQAQADGNPPRDLIGLLEHATRYASEVNGRFEGHLRCALEGDLSPTMQEAVELLTGQRELYFQQPSVFYYPGLAQRRFFESDEFPWLRQMLARVPEMKAELDAVMAEDGAGFAPYV